jgi:hypothetical protein
MEAPRIRIRWLMAVVAFFALNLGAIRAISDIESAIYAAKIHEDYQASVRMLETTTALKLGALPMANILGAGHMIGNSGRGSRRFLWGILAFGAATLALFVAAACFCADSLVLPNLRLTLAPSVGIRPPVITTIPPVIVYSAATFMLVLPQAAFAVIGGFLTRNFRIS